VNNKFSNYQFHFFFDAKVAHCSGWIVAWIHKWFVFLGVYFRLLLILVTLLDLLVLKHNITDLNVLYYLFVTRSCFLRHLQTALAAAMLSTTNVIVTKLRENLVFIITV